MPVTVTLPTPDGGEADIEVTPMNLSLGLSITAVRPPAPAVLPAPAAYWKYDGSLADAAAGGANALTGSPSYTTGKFGQAVSGMVSLTKANQTALSGQIGGAASWTVAFWATLPSGMGPQSRVALYTAGGATRILLALYKGFGGTPHLDAQVYDQQLFLTPAVSAGFHHFALVNDAGAVTLYMDGVSVGTMSAAGVFQTIGADWQWLNGCGDATDDAAVWGVALTAGQVAAIAAAAGDLSTLL